MVASGQGSLPSFWDSIGSRDCMVHDRESSDHIEYCKSVVA
jgi:hypothetical protein